MTSRHAIALCGALLIALLAGNAFAATYEDALLAYNKGDFATALRLYRPLAKRGDTRAQEAIGRMYARGEGVPKNEAEAVRWFRRANAESKALAAYNRGDFTAAWRAFRPLAEKGQLLAQYVVGLMYANGQGVPRDYAQAMKWHRKAADQGEAKAQFSVGLMYFKGLGTKRDYAEAFKWYRRAADQGDPTAQYNLGAMYAKGEAGTRDPVAAQMYYSLAAARGLKAAAAAKATLAKSMSTSQIAEAEKRARAWHPKPEP